MTRHLHELAIFNMLFRDLSMIGDCLTDVLSDPFPISD
jgi:hypothetical protein